MYVEAYTGARGAGSGAAGPSIDGRGGGGAGGPFCDERGESVAAIEAGRDGGAE